VWHSKKKMPLYGDLESYILGSEDWRGSRQKGTRGPKKYICLLEDIKRSGMRDWRTPDEMHGRAWAGKGESSNLEKRKGTALGEKDVKEDQKSISVQVASV